MTIQLLIGIEKASR